MTTRRPPSIPAQAPNRKKLSGLLNRFQLPKASAPFIRAFGQPLTSPEIQAEVFRVSADYMPSNDASRDPYVTSALWSRRFVGVRLFMSLAVAGWSGYALHVEKAASLIDRLRENLKANGWEIASASAMAVLNVIPPAKFGSPADIVSRIQASGGAWISVASYERKQTVRVCITNGQTTEADVDALVGELCANPPS